MNTFTFEFQSEAPLVIKPYIDDMTESEIHAVMTGGFANVAGSTLAAYISFGVSNSLCISELSGIPVDIVFVSVCR